MTREDLQTRMRSRRPAVLMAFDAVALMFAYVLSVWLRYGDQADSFVWSYALAVIAGAVILQWSIGLVRGCYQGRFGVAPSE